MAVDSRRLRSAGSPALSLSEKETLDMNKTFVVLGCHRSATSLIAKALQGAGVHMGDNLLQGLPDNPEGHFEDMDFLIKNVMILGGDHWDKPDTPLQDVDVTDLLARKNVRPLWGWKDPRTSLTIEKYYEHLEDPILVVSFRRPEHVGDSLARRGDMSREEGIKLAKDYNRKLIDFLEKHFT